MPDASVDLIYLDPPFCTQRDWGAFNDKWEDGLDGYLKFMKPRLVEMHRILKDTGSFYLHCDPTASHYLKVMLDGIFGRKQFRNEIVWKRQQGRSNHTHNWFAKEHDTILFYTKSKSYQFHQSYTPVIESDHKRYRHIDEDGRRYMLRRPDKRRKNRIRIYLDKSKGIPLDTLWIKDIQLQSSTSERLDYPTQKPLKLLARIIKASSNQGDVVLDPFCGSGTTLDAAQGLGRHWIGIDQNPDAITITEQRLKDRHALMLEYERITC